MDAVERRKFSCPYWESNSCRQFDGLFLGQGSARQKPFIITGQKKRGDVNPQYSANGRTLNNLAS
jgi:hypothetical protein